MNNISKNIIMTPFNILYKISPVLDLKILFRLKQGYSLNLEHPTTYNEKLQWIKLYDRNELMPICCDKYAVRDVVAKLGCKDILNELYWEGFCPDEIPFEKLPKQFVIKVTHGSTFNIICKDKDLLDVNDVVANCNKWLKTKFLPCYGEWFYGIEKPRIIIEKYLVDDDGTQLRDYKVFCFNGKVHYIRVDVGRFTNHKESVYTRDWEIIPDVHMGHGCTSYGIEKPKCLDELIKYAEVLSKPFKHARVDFYIVKEKVIFGEITFTNGAGFDRFSSYAFDCEIGNKLFLE